MAVLKNNEVRMPFWGGRHSFVSGQNPLGLQGASEALFTVLLPGITNLTNRIRYYSLYCWLLDQYAHRERDTSVNSQRRFLRRAELQIAVLMRIHESTIGNVPGTDHIDPWVSNDKGDVLDLAAHSDLDSGQSNYWQDSWGSFGTYYVGALQQLLLVVKVSDGVYRCTEGGIAVSGVALATAFAESTDPEMRDLFLANVRKGKLNRSDTEALHSAFRLTGIVVGGREHECLQTLIIGPDSQQTAASERDLGTCRRRGTIRQVLRAIDAEEVKDPNDFALAAYVGKGRLLGEQDEITTGWYLYLMNEFWHYGAGAIFYGLLARLAESQTAVHLPLLVQEYVASILSVIVEEVGKTAIATTDDLLKHISSEMEPYEDGVRAALRGYNSARAGAFGWLMMSVLYRSNAKLSAELLPTLRELRADRDGHVLEFIEYLSQRRAEPLNQVLRDFLLRYLIYHHQFVALRKAGAGSLITLKFILEDQYISLVETVEPSYTGSRLPTLFNLFRDMGYLNGDDTLTPDGRALLNSLPV